MYILPESYRDFLHADMYNGSISPGLLIFVIGAVWFPLTPLMYGAVRKYRVQKRLQSPQQSYVYGGNYVTRKGEVVKSYGEKKIADYLYASGIRYEYERPFYGYDEHGRYRLLAHPDFFIPDYRVVVEYFGMAGNSESYDNTAVWKMERYMQNGIHAIAVFPRDLDNLNLSGSCNNTGELPTS